MRYLSVLLLFSFFCFYLSCHKTTLINNESQFRDPLLRRDAVYIKTTNDHTYYYDAKSYKFNNDTLYGEGQKVIGLDMVEESEPLKIAYHDITEIKTKKWDVPTTLVGGVFLAGVLYWHLMWSKVETQ